MAVRMIKKSWWVDLRFNYTRYRKRSPENSRAGALAYEAVLRRKLSQGEEIGKTELLNKPQTFGEFAEQWFASYVMPNNKATEQKAKRHILSASLIPFLGTLSIERISGGDIERYKAWEARKGLSSKTINNKLAVLRKCLSSAYEWMELGAPPKIKALKAPPPKTDHLTMEEAEKLVNHSDGVIREMILMALRTGMRQGELRGLQWEAIDWENGTLTVRHSLCDYNKQLTSPKSNRERYVPLSDDIYTLLAARKQSSGYVFKEKGRPFTGQNLLRALDRVRTVAGLRRIGWHTLRHTFASRLAVNGTSLRVVQELLGHSTINMTMRYSHVVPAHLRAAIRSLTPNSASLGNPWATANGGI